MRAPEAATVCHRPVDKNPAVPDDHHADLRRASVLLDRREYRLAVGELQEEHPEQPTMDELAQTIRKQLQAPRLRN